MKTFIAAATLSLVALAAHATPTTTFWAPSTTAIQPFLVPHLTYDTYFWNKPATGSNGSPIYPVTTGLTMGVLPFENLQLEVGFDLLLPGSDPLLLNAKLGVPEDKLFAFQPSFAVGIFGVGTKTTTATTPGTDFNILYAQLQHTLPVIGGYVSAGGYYSLQDKLFQSSDGSGTQRAGFMGGFTSPDIPINAPWLQKINFTADVQTGKNAFGAAGGGVYFYFSDRVDGAAGRRHAAHLHSVGRADSRSAEGSFRSGGRHHHRRGYGPGRRQGQRRRPRRCQGQRRRPRRCQGQRGGGIEEAMIPRAPSQRCAMSAAAPSCRSRISGTGSPPRCRARPSRTTACSR
jgi:hypothetical protein